MIVDLGDLVDGWGRVFRLACASYLRITYGSCPPITSESDVFDKMYARFADAVVIGVIRYAIFLGFLGLDLEAEAGVVEERAGGE
jgi:hypothetical protein